MNPLSIAGLGLSAGADIFKLIYGFHQMFGKDKKYEEMVNNLPKYQIDQNIIQNKQLAGQYASQGFGSQFLNNAGDAIDRNLGSTINAFTSTGQGVNQIASAQNQSNNAFQQMLMADAMQKAKNRNLLISANKDLRDENLRAWDYNVNMPAQLKLGHFNDMRNAGAQNIYGGAKGLGSDLTGFGSGSKMSGGDSMSMGRSSGGGGYDQFLQYLSMQGLNNAGNTANTNAFNEMNWSYP